MPAPQAHYYLLAGESLHALNRLIEYDRLMTDWKMEGIMAQVDAAMGKTPQKKTDGAGKARGFTGDFGRAQVRGYQQKLGFHDLPVQVRDYADGLVYRAYTVLPKIAMNPGTSKMCFGLIDMVNDPDKQPKERTAVYICYEDYKGEHFAPKGAKKLTAEEFHAYDAIAGSFEYYREYDQGVAMPADFDPEKHLTVPRLPQKDFPHARASQRFVLSDDLQKEVAAYDEAESKWRVDVYQNMRDDISKMAHGFTFGGAENEVYLYLDNIHAPKGARQMLVMASPKVVEKYRADLEKSFRVVEEKTTEYGQVHLSLAPRTDVPQGVNIAAWMDSLPEAPPKPALYAALEAYCTSGTDYAKFDDKILGFPYMQIERPADASVRIFALRLPAGVKDVRPPNKDCLPLTEDEYVALSGAESYFDRGSLPTHAFRIEGETLAKVQSFESDYGAYLSRSAGFRAGVESLLHKGAPGCSIEKYSLSTYKAYADHRPLRLTIAQDDFAKVRDDLFVEFEEHHASRDGGELRQLHLKTRAGSAMAAALEAVPYEPDFPRALADVFGFYSNNGYDLMRLENMQGSAQKAVLYLFPPFIGEAATPAGTKAMDVETFIHTIADSHDISAGTVPPPRPDHVKETAASGSKSLNHAKGIRDSLKEEGLPLGPRSDSSWFTRPYG